MPFPSRRTAANRSLSERYRPESAATTRIFDWFKDQSVERERSGRGNTRALESRAVLDQKYCIAIIALLSFGPQRVVHMVVLSAASWQQTHPGNELTLSARFNTQVGRLETDSGPRSLRSKSLQRHPADRCTIWSAR